MREPVAIATSGTHPRAVIPPWQPVGVVGTPLSLGELQCFSFLIEMAEILRKCEKLPPFLLFPLNHPAFLLTLFAPF